MRHEITLVNGTSSDYCRVRVGQLPSESLGSVYARAREIASAQRSWAVTDNIVVANRLGRQGSHS